MDPEILKKLQKAGQIAAQVREEGAKMLSRPGTSFLQTMDYCEDRILKLGGEIAWAQMAVNETAAHYCPAEDDNSTSQEGDLIKIDLGVHLDGHIADTAMTVQVATDKYNDLIKASQNALKAALKIAKPGTKLWELGEAQYSEAEAMGFTTIKNLSGHTLGQYQVHAGLSLPTFNNKEKTELEEGWTIAIEPFVTPGNGLIKEKGTPTIFMVVKERGVRSPYAKKILDFVKPQMGLPFTIRWLTRKYGKGPATLGLRELQQSNIIKGFPPLIEISKGMVSQTEHSVIVKDKPIIYTKKRL